DELERTLPFVAPRTAGEVQLHAIWQSLLNLPQISVHDSFFQLGGHSLLATQLVSRIHKQFGVKLQLRDIFEQSTIAQIARRLETAGAQSLPPPLSASKQQIQPSSSDERPLSFAQQRLLVIDQLDPNQATYNSPLAFRVDRRLDETALQAAVNILYARHDSLRTTFPATEDGRPYQHVGTDLHLPIHLIDFTSVPQSEREAEATA